MREILLQNNNRKAISRLSRRYLKAGRGRNLIAVLAIALTTMMFTSLFTIGSSFLALQQEQTMRQVGGSAHGGFKYLTWEEYDRITTHPSIRAHGASIAAGMGENAALSKMRAEIRWTDENYAKWSFSMPTTGKLPEAETELATSTVVLDALGIPHELGAAVPLEFTYHGKQYKEMFTLCGFWEGDPVMEAHAVFLSRTYMDKIVTVSTESYYTRADTSPFGTLNLDVMLGSPTNTESKLNKIVAESGYAPGDIELGVNWAYLGSGAPDAAMLLIVAILLLLIGGAGYLIIYNVFYISVTRDIRAYGLLKTLGTTPRQLKRLVSRQALLLSAAGIPLGLAAGYAMGYLLLPAMLAITSLAGIKPPLTLNLWVPLCSAAFALITVWLSCRKPGKLAAAVSPIEALRTFEASAGGKKARRSGRVSTSRMAWHNVTRSKKRMALVALSLTLSIVLLNSVYGATKSFDIDKYMSRNILTDFSIAEADLLTNFNTAYLPPQIIGDLSSLPGITAASPVYMREMQLAPEQKISDAVEALVAASPDMRPNIASDIVKRANTSGLPAHVYGIDEFLYEKLEFAGEKPSWEEFSAGNFILASLIGRYEEATPVFFNGDTITLSSDDGTPQSYTMLAEADVPYPSTPMHGHISEITLVLPQERYLESFGQDSLMYLHLQADEAAVPALENTIAQYCAQRTASYNSRATYMAEFTQLERTYLLVGGVLGGILGLVGILNFVNAITTSILTRRHELAMLQSVGMTTKQLRRMLMCEGLWYIVLTGAIVLTLGNLLSALLTQAIAGQMWFFTFHFTMAPMLLCLPLLLVPALLIPQLAYRSVSRQSAVERLRENE